MKALLFASLTIALAITSCNEIPRLKDAEEVRNSSNTVLKIRIYDSLNYREDVLLSTIASEIEYIPLETTKNCLLGNEINISLTDSFIFVSDPRKLLKFDRSGKFISQIGASGRGPGEYLYVFDIETDNKSGLVYLLSYPNLLVYTTGGRFVRSFRIWFKTSHFILTDSDHLVFYPLNIPLPAEVRDFSWYVTDTCGNLIDSIPNYHKRVNFPGIWITEVPMYNFNGNTYMMEAGSDSLFSLYGESNLAAVFNLGYLKLDYDKSISVERRMEIMRSMEQDLRIESIQENNDNIFMKFTWGYSDSTLFAFYQKHSGMITFLAEEGFLNNIDGGIRLWPQMIFSDSLMIDVKSPGFLIRNKGQLLDKVEPFASENSSSGIKQMFEKIDENSNPVIIVFK